MKKIFGLVTALVLVVIGLSTAAPNAWASEGRVYLNGGSDGPVCHGFSVYMDNTYNLQLTCRGLVVPYSAEIRRYAAWVSADGKKWGYLGEVNGGKLFGRSDGQFAQVQVTAEPDRIPRSPSEHVVARGTMEALDFAGQTAGKTQIQTQTTKEVVPTPKVDSVQEMETEPQAGVISRVVGVVGRALAIGFVVLLVGVVVLTFISRRRNL